MNNKRIIKYSTITFLSITILLATAYTIIKTKEPNIVNLHAKVDGYETLTDLEDSTPIILKGIKISEEEPVFSLNPDDGSIFTGYTLSDFQITSVIKNTTTDDLLSASIIPIFENEALHKNTNTIYRVSGYEKMVTGNEYLLFLRKSNTDANYIPMGVIYGQIPLEDSQSSRNYVNETKNDSIVMIKNMAKEKYKDYK